MATWSYEATWEARMKIITGTAQALAIEPKLAHRYIKANNILIEDEFNAKLSDFALAKLLDSDESHISFGCVDHEAEKRPRMSQIARMLESDEHPFHKDSRNRTTEEAEPRAWRLLRPKTTLLVLAAQRLTLQSLRRLVNNK